MKKQLILLSASILLCFFLGIGAGAAAFAAACIFAGAPVKPHTVIIAALAADILAMLTGEGELMFWGLLVCAASLLSLASPLKSALLVGAAALMLRFAAPPSLYIAVFGGIIYSAIFLFTYEKNCDTINIANRIKTEGETQNG